MDILFFIVAGAFTLLSLWITVSGIRAHEKSEIVPGLVTLAMGLGFFVLYLLECWMALAVIFLLIGFIACSFTTMWFNDLRNSHERARLYVEPTLVWVYGIASYLIAAYAFECNGEHLTLYTIIFSILMLVYLGSSLYSFFWGKMRYSSTLTCLVLATILTDSIRRGVISSSDAMIALVVIPSIICMLMLGWKRIKLPA